jgi:hypothetical protein
MVITILYFLDLYGASHVEARNENTLTISRADGGYISKPNSTIAEDKLLNCVPTRFKNSTAAVNKLWNELTGALGDDGGHIVLRTSEAKIARATDTDLTVAEMTPKGTVVFTRSAIGALNLAQDERSITFTSHEAADVLHHNNEDARKDHCYNGQIYLLPGDNAENRFLSTSDRWDEFNSFPFEPLEQSRREARMLEGIQC